MFLVLIEYIDDCHKEWSVMPHGRQGLRHSFCTREEADKIAMAMAKVRTNRFTVVEVTHWYQQGANKIEVKKVFK